MSKVEIKISVISLNIKTKTSGSIPMFILKYHIIITLLCLTDSKNISIYKSQFPETPKYADIIQVFKKEDETDKANYCCISVLSSISKTFEKTLFAQIETFMDNLPTYIELS